jgi:hypothetical protein
MFCGPFGIGTTKGKDTFGKQGEGDLMMVKVEEEMEEDCEFWTHETQQGFFWVFKLTSTR